MQRKDGDTRRCFYCNHPDTLSAIVQIDVRSEDASTRPPCKGLLARKRQRGVCKGQQASPIPVSPKRTIIVATIKTQAANIIGKVGNVQIEMLMDSGSFISQDIAKRLKEFTQRPLPQITLKTASGEIPPQVCIQNMVAPVDHDFVVADHLIAPVILGTDFLRQHELILDLSNKTVGVYPKQVQAPQQELQSFWEETVKHKPHIGAVAVLQLKPQKNVPFQTMVLSRTLNCQNYLL